MSQSYRELPAPIAIPRHWLSGRTPLLSSRCFPLRTSAHHGFCRRCFCLLSTAGHGDQRLADRRNEAKGRPFWQLTENPFLQQSQRHALVTMARTAEGEAFIDSCNIRHALLDFFCRQCDWVTILVSVPIRGQAGLQCSGNQLLKMLLSTLIHVKPAVVTSATSMIIVIHLPAVLAA